MANGVGFLLILGCVFGSFLMSGGKLEVIFHALPHELMAIGGAASVLMFSFVGWEAGSHLAGELKDPAAFVGTLAHRLESTL